MKAESADRAWPRAPRLRADESSPQCHTCHKELKDGIDTPSLVRPVDAGIHQTRLTSSTCRGLRGPSLTSLSHNTPACPLDPFASTLRVKPHADPAMQNGNGLSAPSAVKPVDESIQSVDTTSARSVYRRNRVERDARQHAILLQQPLLSVDPLLAAMEAAGDYSLDSRHNLALVARPPQHVKALVTELQQQLHTLAGDALWLSPPHYLHITVYEVSHSRTTEQLQPLVAAIRSHGSQLFDALPLDRVKFDSPLVNYDTAAVALTFLPVDVDGCDITVLRAELGRRVAALGIEWDGRYVPSSAHITIGRFIRPQLQCATMDQWLGQMDKLRERCKQWQGEWCLAHGPLQVMTGKSWYGGGDVVIQHTVQ